MKNSLLLIVVIGFYMIVTPAFQCGDRYPGDNCTNYITDTVLIPTDISNHLSSINIYDTIKFSSTVNDTLQPRNTSQFVYPFTALNSNIQAFKVVNNGSGPILNYANIEFNPLVFEGQFQNYFNQGYGFLYNRNEPNNFLKGGLVAGRSGLYLFTVNTNNNYYEFLIYKTCSQYKVLNYIPQTQQQKQIWDSLGVSVLRLNGNYNQDIAKKSDMNYFFVRVN
jgi:hypothetical protein